jgi:hypothetical protein
VAENLARTPSDRGLDLNAAMHLEDLQLTRIAAALLALALVAPAGVAGGEGPGGDLDWTIGAWQGLRREGGGGTGAPLTLRVAPILGGAGLTEHLEVTHEGGVYRGFAVTVYSAEDRAWVRQYVNATRGRFVRLEGEVEGDRSTWRATTPGRTHESRLVSERLAGERWRRTQLVSDDGGGTWRILWEDELERSREPLGR